MSRFTNDADNVQLALEQSVVQLLSSAISFIGTVVMMLVLSPLLFLITLAVLAIILVLFQKLGGLSRKFYRQQQAALGAVNGAVQENIEGLKVVKAFTHEDATRAEFNQLNENYRVSASKATTYSMMLMPLSAQLTNVGYAVTAVVGGVLSVLSGFDVGGLVSFLTYAKQVSQPINQISMQMTTILSAMAGAERIFEVMDAQPEVNEGKVTLVHARWEGTPSGEGLEPEGERQHWAWKVPDTAAQGRPAGGARGGGAPPHFVLRLCAREGSAPPHQRLRQAGPEDRLCGIHRRRQDHHYQPDQPVLRDPVRLHHL